MSASEVESFLCADDTLLKTYVDYPKVKKLCENQGYFVLFHECLNYETMLGIDTCIFIDKVCVITYHLETQMNFGFKVIVIASEAEQYVSNEYACLQNIFAGKCVIECDSVLLQALFHENYLLLQGGHKHASNCVSHGDIFHTWLYNGQNWDLLNVLLHLACVCPMQHLKKSVVDLNYLQYCSIWTKISSVKSRTKVTDNLCAHFDISSLEELLIYRRNTLECILAGDFNVHKKGAFTMPILTSLIKLQDDDLRKNIKQSIKTKFIKYVNSA